MSVDDIKERVVDLGYYEDRMKEMYYSRCNVPLRTV